MSVPTHLLDPDPGVYACDARGCVAYFASADDMRSLPCCDGKLFCRFHAEEREATREKCRTCDQVMCEECRNMHDCDSQQFGVGA